MTAEDGHPLSPESSARAGIGPGPDAEQNPSSASLFYHSKSNATAIGLAVASDLNSNMLSTIDACVRTLAARRAFENDIEAFDAFLKPLLDAKLLSPSEARLRWASPKLSKLCSVGENADKLRHEKLVHYFVDGAMSGFTLAYQATVLLDQMPEGQPEEARIEQLVDTLRHKGITTLAGMRNLTKELKASTLGQSSQTPEPVELLSRDFGTLSQSTFDLVVAAPSQFDLRKLDEWYANDDHLPRCLKIGALISEDAILIAVVPLRFLPVIVDKLLPGCGFDGISPRVLLANRPSGPDVTNAFALVIAQRAKDRVRAADFKWLTENDLIDGFAIAQQLTPDAKNKLCLFASADREACVSIIGDANWEVADV